jgi:hypothetical protein
VSKIYSVLGMPLIARFNIGDEVFVSNEKGIEQYGKITGINALIIDDMPYLTYMIFLNDGTYINEYAYHVFVHAQESMYVRGSYVARLDLYDGSVQSSLFSTNYGDTFGTYTNTNTFEDCYTIATDHT